MTQRLITTVVAGLLISGCAAYEPPRPAPQTPSGPESETQSGRDTQTKSDKGIGQTRALKRDRVETTGTTIERDRPERMRRDTATPPPKTIKANASAAVMSLVNKADQAMNKTQPGRASALVERALNIAPRNPFLYQRLAAIRLVQDQPAQAIQLARKSNSLAGRNPFVKRNNWALIAEARKMQGRAGAARQAISRARKFERISSQYSL